MREKRVRIVALVGALLATVGAGAARAAAPDAGLAAAAQLGAARVPFVENRGQIPEEDVRFSARTLSGNLFVTAAGELVYALPVVEEGRATGSWAFRETFSGAAPARVRGAEPGAAKIHVFRGGDPRAWRSGLATFGAVELGELWPGIGVTLAASGRNVEKLFRVAPGADAGAIEVAVDGVERLSLDPDGRLVLGTPRGEILLTAPVAFQTVAGERRPVEVAYALREASSYGFRLGAHDPGREVVIDPLLAATYLGGHNPSPQGNYDDDIVLDLLPVGGEVYLAGVTQSPDFPVHLGYDETYVGTRPDGFVTRMSADLTTVLSSTYLGTDDGFDRVTGLALAGDGSILVVGQAGYGFPVTEGAYTWSGTTPTGGGFVAKLSADLSSLEASAIPTPVDYPRTVATGNGGVYFAGATNYPDFPITPGAWRSTCCAAGPFGIREYNGFAGKLSADLTALEAMTYLEGRTAVDLAVAPGGTVYVADGFDYAVTGTLAGFDPALTDRTAHLGYYPGTNSGSTRTYFNAVAAGDGFVVAAGQTYMNDLPATPGAYDTTCGTDGLCDGVGPLLVPVPDGFVAIYSSDLQTTVALTYFGASGAESIRSLALAPDGDVLVAGETTSVDFPTAGDGVDTECGIDGFCDPTGQFDTPTPDAFVARLSQNLSELVYGTYFGGSGEEHANVVAAPDGEGQVFAGGFTRSLDLPTTLGAFDETYNGGTSDAFVVSHDTGDNGGNGPLIFRDGFESGDLSAW